MGEVSYQVPTVLRGGHGQPQHIMLMKTPQASTPQNFHQPPQATWYPSHLSPTSPAACDPSQPAICFLPAVCLMFP